MKFVWEANIAGEGLARIESAGGVLTAVTVLGPEVEGADTASPGWMDIQLNGYAGVDFSDPHLEPEQLRNVVPLLWRSGTAQFCPTLVTNSREALSRNLRVLEAARRADAAFAAAAPCYHLEGPYFQPGGARGVHSVEWMRPPDWEEFCALQEAAGGRVGIITLDPSTSGCAEFTARASAAGVIVGIGHTEASAAQIHAVVDAGARLCTHLGNGCGPILPRHDNPIWPQLARDELTASIICDGFHLPRDVVRSFVLAKGVERLVLITDATHVAGLEPGRYRLVDTDIELLPDGKVIRADGGSLAGSALTMAKALFEFVRLGAVPLASAIRAASFTPRRLLSLPCAGVTAGAPADLIRFQMEPGGITMREMRIAGISSLGVTT